VTVRDGAPAQARERVAQPARSARGRSRGCTARWPTAGATATCGCCHRRSRASSGGRRSAAPAPRAIVEAIARRAIPGGGDGWTAAGVDEFLRSYLDPRGRAAFYAAARNIYLEEPHGEDGFWTRLPSLAVPSLFVWGRRDPLVPLAFAGHVRRALPAAKLLELTCGHVPQLERPKATHDAIARFLAAD